MNIKTISIIGSGNIAYHYAKEFSGNCKLVSIHSRNQIKGKALAEEHFCFYAETIQDILPSDLILVCVSDDSVNEIINLLPVDQHVAYTSGSVSLKSLDRKQKNGVIYPLQTFSAHVPVDFYNIPIFIEGSDEYFAQTLFDFAWKHSRQVVFADSELRLKLHLAAVMVNNFVNHIHSLAEDFLTNNQVEYHFLHSLIEETARKATKYSPNQSQTGPAKRNDKKTIYKHLSMLSENEKNIYKELTNSILKKYNHEEL